MSRNNQQNPRSNPASAAAGSTPLDDAMREEAEDGDQRTVRRDGSAERGARGLAEDAERAEDGLMSAEDYEQLVLNEFQQTALPQPPALPGWHLCWLTTTSQYDSIAKRQRIGYKPVMRSEMPGFDPSNGADLAKFEGFVTCNEMVLHKIPVRYFQQMMNHFHHKTPGEMEAGTLQKIKAGNEAEQDSNGRTLGETLGAGFLDMEATAKRSTARPPTFAS